MLLWSLMPHIATLEASFQVLGFLMIGRWHREDMRLIVVICRFARGKKHLIAMLCLQSRCRSSQLGCPGILIASHFTLHRLLSIRHPLKHDDE